jgi:uncharacterized protein YdaU (DUF1376 family)
MPAIPYQPFHWADYFADTSHLSTLEHGAYLLLIAAYWQSKKPLDANPECLARIAKLTKKEWLTLEPRIKRFFTERDGQWHHARIDADLKTTLAKIDQNVRAGKASAASRWGDRPKETLTDAITPVITDAITPVITDAITECQPRASESIYVSNSSSVSFEDLEQTGKILPISRKAPPGDDSFQKLLEAARLGCLEYWAEMLEGPYGLETYWWTLPIEDRMAQVHGIYVRIDAGVFGPAAVDKSKIPGLDSYVRKAKHKSIIRAPSKPAASEMERRAQMVRDACRGTV